jgi:hypothetical protein
MKDFDHRLAHHLFVYWMKLCTPFLSFVLAIVSAPVIWNFLMLHRHWKDLSTGACLMKKENHLEYWVGGLHVQSHL